MKIYRVYLKNGVSFLIKASRFNSRVSGEHPFYTESDKPDHEVYVKWSEVVAVIPVERLIEEESK